MEMVGRIANMRIVDPHRTNAMIRSGEGFEVDGKLCFSVPDNVETINEKNVSWLSWTVSTRCQGLQSWRLLFSDQATRSGFLASSTEPSSS